LWPARIIVPFPPGGSVDLIAHKRHSLTEQFIVANRGGANGTIGSDAVTKAAPDGYTMLVQASTLVTSHGFKPVGSTPDQFSAFIEKEIKRHAGIVRGAKIKVQQ
jgi:tripartite-type tricarboxylate transporter receptor subunit TctC